MNHRHPDAFRIHRILTINRQLREGVAALPYAEISVYGSKRDYAELSAGGHGGPYLRGDFDLDLQAQPMTSIQRQLENNSNRDGPCHPLDAQQPPIPHSPAESKTDV
jgi:hypothetical protein